MAEQEEKPEEISYAERLAKAMESLKGQPLPADFDEFDTPLRADIVEEIHRLLDHNEN